MPPTTMARLAQSHKRATANRSDLSEEERDTIKEMDFGDYQDFVEGTHVVGDGARAGVAWAKTHATLDSLLIMAIDHESFPTQYTGGEWTRFVRKLLGLTNLDSPNDTHQTRQFCAGFRYGAILVLKEWISQCVSATGSRFLGGQFQRYLDSLALTANPIKEATTDSPAINTPCAATATPRYSEPYTPPSCHHPGTAPAPAYCQAPNPGPQNPQPAPYPYMHGAQSGMASQ